ncbi:Major allergen Pru ar 1 [Vitis vinifera]|uniref:Major allergen Pru ar 1 n=1 Tax=Vitis vinifera TaxID=29760 RepID=A0A438DWW3_VITVI|nr:Major allergen Pru ar 1 [Vitis vinifera]
MSSLVLSCTTTLQALILEADSLLPKVVPQAIKSSQFKYVKHRIDELDKEKMIYKYTLIEGDALMDKIEYISYEISFEASPDGGCKSKNVSVYHLKPGVEIKEEEIKDGKEKAAAVFKAVEAYLLANPDA